MRKISSLIIILGTFLGCGLNTPSETGGTTNTVHQDTCVTCKSLNAECGSIFDNGCGNTIDCPDTCSGVNYCGGGGIPFKCGCTPVSCELQRKNCGIIDDFCGGKIDCGSCDPNKYQTTCGDASSIDPDNGMVRPPQANVCGGGCGFVTSVSSVCQGTLYTFEWRCDQASQPISVMTPPIKADCIQPDPSNPYLWCCDNDNDNIKNN